MPLGSEIKTSERGAATVEAAVMLSFFVMLFIAMFYVRGATASRLLADQEARRCAWQYSVSGCDHIPAGCDGVVAMAPSPSVLKELEDIKGDAESKLTGMKQSPSTDRVVDMVKDKVLGALGKAFNRDLESTKILALTKPVLFGGGEAQVLGRYRLPCNVRTEQSSVLGKDLWGSLTK